MNKFRSETSFEPDVVNERSLGVSQCGDLRWLGTRALLKVAQHCKRMFASVEEILRSEARKVVVFTPWSLESLNS